MNFMVKLRVYLNFNQDCNFEIFLQYLFYIEMNKFYVIYISLMRFLLKV